MNKDVVHYNTIKADFKHGLYMEDEANALLQRLGINAVLARLIVQRWATEPVEEPSRVKRDDVLGFSVYRPQGYTITTYMHEHRRTVRVKRWRDRTRAVTLGSEFDRRVKSMMRSMEPEFKRLPEPQRHMLARLRIADAVIKEAQDGV